MKMPAISLVEWQKRFGTEKACTKALEKIVGQKIFNALPTLL